MIEIVNPSGIPRVGRSRLALRRFDDLAGKRIGLLDNNKPNADRFLEFVGARLKERYADIELVTQRKMTRMEADVLPALIQRSDVVINAFAD